MPPAVPPPSQPPPTPNAPHFLLPKRPDRPAATPTRKYNVGAPGWLAAGSTPAPATVRSSQPRPTPRFVPSWTQSQSTPVRAHDEIDEDSSPPRAALKATAETTTPRAADGTTGQPRSTQPTQQTPSASRTPWQPRWQSARRPQVREDIEDAEDSDLDLDDDGGEPIDGLSLASQKSDEEQTGHESESEEQGESGQEQSHQQLQSPARPYKRRRLFVSSGRGGKKIRNVGRRQGQLVDDIEEGNDDGSDADNSDNANSDDHTFGDYYRGRQMSFDEIGEILKDEELRHGWEPPDDKADVYDAEEEDFMIFNATPSRRKTSGRRISMETEARLEQQQQPSFQRARLFLTTGKSRKSGTTAAGEDAVDARDMGTEDGGDENGEDGDEDTGNASADWQQQQEHRNPPPDFFSPRKQQRKRGRKPVQQRGDTSAATAASIAEVAAPVSGDGQFMAGGLAAELRNWLVQIKVQARSSGRTGGSTGTIRPLRYVVEEARLSSGMCLVLGRPEAKAGVEATSKTALRLLLAGDGRREPAEILAGGRVVEIVPPVWDVVIEGETWTVASSWAVE